MFKASKGDLIFEPIDLLVRFMVRFVSEIIGAAIEKDPATHWSFAEWLIFIIFIVTCVVILAVAIRSKFKQH